MIGCVGDDGRITFSGDANNGKGVANKLASVLTVIMADID
jgi:hypothetical protein